MNIAVAYIRVSTGKQAESGLGLDAQRAAITKYAKANDLNITEWFEDAGISGADAIEDRPALANALTALKRGHVLIVAKRDRLARNSDIAAAIEMKALQKGASIKSAADAENHDTSPMGKFMRVLLDALSELERGLIAARTKAAHAELKKRGRWPGGKAPYGFRIEGKNLIQDPTEQKAVARIKQLAAEGVGFSVSMGQILAGEGIKPRTGGKWHENQLRRIAG